MPNSSSELHAAILALHGESDIDVVYPAIAAPILAQVIALASSAYPVIRTVAALRSGLTALLDTSDIADPALHDAVVRLIETDVRNPVLDSFAKIAPAGWGRNHAAILTNAAQRRMCSPCTVTALIGPCDESAALLRNSGDIAFALRRWGQSPPDAPTAWMDELSSRERNRLINTVQNDIYVVSCLPWLPPDAANRTQFDNTSLVAAIDAFTEASPTARALHAALVQRIIAQAQSEHLVLLTRLACAMGSEDVWARVQTLIQDSPDEAVNVVVAAPWDDLTEPVRAVIMKNVDRYPVIDAARGRQFHSLEITWSDTIVFFAAIDPGVWDALASDVQRSWLCILPELAAHFAVRSLGPRPEILAKTKLDNALVQAARRYVPNTAALHWALLPVALRSLPPDALAAIMTALPIPPSDLSAFFSIVVGRSDPDIIVSTRPALRTRNDLVIAAVMQRCADRSASIGACCMALHDALREQSGKGLEPILLLLDDNVRDAINPDYDALVERLARPDRKEALRQALERLTPLPLEVAIPTRYTLHRWGSNAVNAHDAASAFAFVLREHGDVFLAIVGALADDELRTALLPLPEDAARASALCDLAYDDPPTAQRLAYALRNEEWRAATEIVLLLQAHHRDALTPTADGLVERLALPDRQDVLRRTMDRLASLSPDINIPVRFALDWLGTNLDDAFNEPVEPVAAAEDIARALRAHGDMFLAMVDALANNALRAALLPLPEDAAHARALRDLAYDDPPTAQRLAYALRNEEWRTATEIVLSLSTHHRNALIPALDALVERLAHPDRRENLHQALDHLASLSPNIDILARFALGMETIHASAAVAEDIALALREHGNVFLAMVDALADHALRAALLPLPEDAALADALRDFACDDPPSAQRMAYALYSEDWISAIHVLLTAPPHHADVVWQTLDNAVRSEMVAHVSAVPSDADPIAIHTFIATLALAAMQSDDDDLRNAGVAALAARPDVLRAMWDNLPQAMQQSLREHPDIAVAVADLPLAHDHAADRRIRRR